MLLIDNFPQVMAQIEKERGIGKQPLLDAISAAIIAACKKKFGNVENLEVTIDEDTGEAMVFASREVVKKIEEGLEFSQIVLSAAKEYQDDVEVGDVIMVEVTPDKFGRIAAQTAKQVILQRIREAEKSSVFDEFKGKEGTILTGNVQRKEGRNYLINLGRSEAVLYYREQIPGEKYNLRDMIKVYLVEVELTPKGPKIHISRTHPRLLKSLFELEVPEVSEGIIEVMAVSREAGTRAKVAVKSNDQEIGAVGTCVGHMGGRIQNIVKELGNEKIDIIEWSDDPYELLVNALRPAKINKITLEETEQEKTATIYVNEDQLSLAIGKGGQNVRLASKLTGWKIEIVPEKSSLELNIKKALAEQNAEDKKDGGEEVVKEEAKEKTETEKKEEEPEAKEEKKEEKPLGDKEKPLEESPASPAPKKDEAADKEEPAKKEKAKPKAKKEAKTKKAAKAKKEK